ncbi:MULTISPECIES: NEL-type E3 ubiquitin ligase domain-containing protein [unclassified Pseudomonas]|uniref:NEL-type E3 ubiquitin ligase domain-containing protein n=4 Tax=Bacteria TaxID=2 RepID=UPI002B2386EB|nr:MULTISPECIES: NEL-type E3 ubiquitin ligase domain-containing protein [unclassified Pseudomonas]MEA9979153.1 NEL-type E3 ubiquitin ligase domain-containing protein [Pseudomonas sp. RTS4]MEB0199335.1 NEL-type E3 ubiquitin ligase domain-containing protein [Pseudomonas sp. 5S4]MEB0246732.1 NEL-type E3 ubiquitin ligase domain-containing protein [Pseudomonas sp. 10S5]
MSDTSSITPATSHDDDVFEPWKQHRANHALVKSRLPVWYSAASTELRAALRKSQLFSLFSRRDLKPLRQKISSVKAFAEPLLEKALIDTFDLRLDLHENDLVTVHSQTFLGVDRRRPFRQSLLQAALQNFELFEVQEGGFERGAALLPHDGLQMQLVTGTGVNGSYPRFRYTYSGVIDIKAAKFAQMCRTLDLGARYQRHLDSIFKPAALPGQSAEELASEVASKFQCNEQDNVQVLAHIARMKNQISQSAYEMMLALTTSGSTPMWGAEPVRHCWLRLLESIDEHGSMLFGALLIEPDKKDDGTLPCVVYMPGEPDHPLKEYVSFRAFTDALRRKLSGEAYQEYFRRFISLGESQRFFQRLNERLKPLRPLDGNLLSSGLRERVFDPQAKMSLEKFAHSGAPFQMLYEHLLTKTYGDSRVLAVPTNDEDQKTRMRRLQAFESSGMDLLNIASFFIPVLGAAMAVVAVEQVLSDIFVGVIDWQDGEIDEALTHLFEAAENIAFAGAMAVGANAASVASVPSAFIEHLVPIKLKNGQTRLWKPDLAPFQQDVTLPNWVMANAEARVEVNGKNYLPLAGKLYQVKFDTALNKWRLHHPIDANAYSPVLSHNNTGAWRHEGENPMGWDVHTAFKRLHPALDGMSELTIDRILAVTQVDEALLRQIHVESLKPPALLSDSILRFQIENQIDGFTEAMNSGNLHDIRCPHIDPYVELLTILSGWPEQRSVRLLDAQGAVLKVFGSAETALPSIDLRYLPGQIDDVITSILTALKSEEIETLLGEYNTREQSQSSRLARQLAELAGQRRRSLHESVYRHQSLSDAAPVKLIQRDFPAIPTLVANEIIESASAQEVSQMNTSSRLPLRIAEQAREYQQQVRLNRVNEGFYFKGVDHPDINTVGLRLLSRLPGWPANVALEIRESTFSGELLDSVGDPSATLRWVLVKSGERYQAFDSVGNATQSGGDSFYRALLQALPADSRRAIGLSSADEESELREALGAVAVAHRDEVAVTLGMQAIKPGLKWPHKLPDGRIGYPMSGRIRQLFSRLGCGARNHSAQLAVKTLFPAMTDIEVRTFIDELRLEFTGLNSERSAYVQGKIRELEAEYQKLETTLDQWVEMPSESRVRGRTVQAAVEEDKRVAARHIKLCWKRMTENRFSEQGVFVGYTMYLSHLSLGVLPQLTARFDHVSSLFVNSLGLTTSEANAFLGQFSTLRELYMHGNELTSVPEAITLNTSLNHLSLRDNPLILDAASVMRLQRLTHLRNLDLNHCPIGPLLEVGRMRRLARLNIRGTGVDALPVGLVDCGYLTAVDARNNRIVDIPENLFYDSHEIFSRIQLHDNPINEQTRERARRVFSDEAIRIMGLSNERIHVEREVSPIAFWLAELPGADRSARFLIWNELQAEPESYDFFRVLFDLTASADYGSDQQGLTQRVWTVMQAATAHGALRDELFALAAHPETCSDGSMLVFNNLEIRVLVFKAMLSAQVGAQETELFELARGLERLDEVERFALSDIKIRSASNPLLDEAEVRLAYRVGLARRLNLPLQPRGMLFSSLAGVTEEAINAAEQRVLYWERRPGFLQAMVARDFWMAYLERRYATRFEPVQTPFHERLNDLDERASATLRTGEYMQQIELIQKERTEAINQLARQLTQEIARRHAAGVVSPTL